MTALKLYLESLNSKVSEIQFKAVTLQSLGDLFDNDLSLPGCVIQDYTKLILDLVDELEQMICAKKDGRFGLPVDLGPSSSSDDYAEEVLS